MPPTALSSGAILVLCCRAQAEIRENLKTRKVQVLKHRVTLRQPRQSVLIEICGFLTGLITCVSYPDVPSLHSES